MVNKQVTTSTQDCLELLESLSADFLWRQASTWLPVFCCYCRHSLKSGICLLVWNSGGRQNKTKKPKNQKNQAIQKCTFVFLLLVGSRKQLPTVTWLRMRWRDKIVAHNLKNNKLWTVDLMRYTDSSTSDMFWWCCLAFIQNSSQWWWLGWVSSSKASQQQWRKEVPLAPPALSFQAVWNWIRFRTDQDQQTNQSADQSKQVIIGLIYVTSFCMVTWSNVQTALNTIAGTSLDNSNSSYITSL